MRVGVQFNGDVPAAATRQWFTHSWPQDWHVVWSVVPTSPVAAGPQLEWDVSVERASAGLITYWISVRNLTSSAVSCEARYAVLDP